MHFDHKVLSQKSSESILIYLFESFCQGFGKQLKRTTISQSHNQKATFKCCRSAISII